MNKRIKDIIEYAIIIIVVLLFRQFLFSPIRVSGDSMVPTLLNGDIMLLNKIGYALNGVERFDIVVVNYNGEKIIKRVIGLPGDEVEYNDDKLYINGNYVEEKYEREKTSDFILQMIGEKVVPEGKYLVLGDNRPISKDSRIIGLIDENDIEGYTGFVFFPFKRIGKVR